ncbi:MAG: hypothetical protein SOR57_13230 [Parabacteroides sp.]|nr:hypothetical protein [Parabacteroides sp.]
MWNFDIGEIKPCKRHTDKYLGHIPPYINKTLQDHGIIHHTREQKLEAMERFKDFQPTGGINIPEHACQYIIKSQAMAWLLMQEFDKWGEMRA